MRAELRSICTAVVVLGLLAPNALARSTAGAQVVLSLDENPILRTREVIGRAQHTIDAVVYKFDEKGTRKALEEALERGVRVRLLADASEAQRKRSRVEDVRDAGAEVRVWQDGKLHAKFAIVDGSEVLTGSFNWTESAQHENVELMLDVRGPELAAHFAVAFERLWGEGEKL